MTRPSPRSLRAAGLLLAVLITTVSCRLVPDLDRRIARADPLAQTSKIYDRRGRVITTLHAEEDRILVQLRRIPEAVQDAVVAIEDQRFWTHRGVDARAILRAAYVNATSGEIVEGGSTITQQYVRKRLLSERETLERKIDEAGLAIQFEEEHSKKEILEGYLNTVYFGHGAYGIQRAAKTYFSLHASQLDLPRAALLAGLISSPERWDPLDRRKAALGRRNLVLSRMHELGFISDRRYREAVATPLGLNPNRQSSEYPAAHFVDYVKHHILSNPRFGDTYRERYRFLFEGGLRIYTTIDLDMQRAAESAVRGILSQPGDPYGALTAIDPRTGRIRAMVGGRNYWAPRSVDRYAKVNLATGGSTGRQAGSAFKPFALVAALESGISPSQTYPASSSRTFTKPPCGSPEDPWQVENYEGSGYGSMSVASATVNSVNVVYSQIIEDVGPERVVEVARRMGIRSRLRPYCSSVLGTNEVNTMEMASAFGTLATMGKHAHPQAILRIENARGKVLYEPKVKRQQALDPAVAYTANDILRDVVCCGTGTAANIGRPQAGKTGTAQMWRDAWYVGYIPQLVAAVWVGWPQGQISMTGTRIGNVTGGSFPAMIWRAFMVQVAPRFEVQDFSQPADRFIEIPIDVTRGCVANEDTPEENIEYVPFNPGSTPREQCPEVAGTSGVVPSVIGMSEESAYEVLAQAGFTVVQSIEDNEGYPPGTVLDQDPSAGTPAEPGSTVALIVSG
ncbi:MAG TPA: PBP1A family penicillin-binding protein [Actinomycetota bacterium]|nr:PBP1A family penicillin-binding protein [Actinomycetota bacterium]